MAPEGVDLDNSVMFQHLIIVGFLVLRDDIDAIPELIQQRFYVVLCFLLIMSIAYLTPLGSC